MDYGKLLLLATASCGFLFGQIEYLKPDGLAPANGYSHAVVAHPGKLVFIAGQVANDRKGHIVGNGDLKAQTEQAFRNLKSALAAAGTDFNHVVKINWYIKDYRPESLAIIREVRNKYLNAARLPASTLVGVASLFQEDCLIEVEVTAVIPDSPLLGAREPRTEH
jgi:enamine deaminase RidA (YjgF/YER057c/UK114 family)